jgi:hypothetical protein
MKYLINALAALALCAILTACSHTPSPDISSPPAATFPAPTSDETAEPTSTTPTPPLVPEHEVELVAKTLRGECFDEQHDDKREVVRVICNRVADGRFGDSVEAVITAPRQFVGYRPGNVPTANDTEIAREILTEWYAGGCRALGKYLYFSSGGGHKNLFRENY